MSNLTGTFCERCGTEYVQFPRSKWCSHCLFDEWMGRFHRGRQSNLKTTGEFQDAEICKASFPETTVYSNGMKSHDAEEGGNEARHGQPARELEKE